MEKQSYQSVYCYPGESVLINKLDCHDKNKLETYERTITTLRMAEISLGRANFPIRLDVQTYLNIHQYLFSDIYPFAGEIRTEMIHKPNPYANGNLGGKTVFCMPGFILENLKSTLNQMKNKVRFIKTREQLLTFLTNYYCDLNIIHPFREGNGRTLRVFLELYVKALNSILPFEPQSLEYRLLTEEDMKKMMDGVMLDAVTNGGRDLIYQVFDKCLVPKTNQMEENMEERKMK